MAKTEVILTHNIVGLGGESDNVRVAAGYARNYLYPQGLAVPVTSANKRQLEALKQRRAEREAHEFNTMNELAKGFTALADPVRLRLINLLGAAPGGEVCICNIVEPIGKSQPTISHHMKLLVDAGLVHGERRGKWVWYALDRGRLSALRAALDA